MKTLDDSFKFAYSAFEEKDYVRSKNLFLKHNQIDTMAWHYESYTFLAECYRQLGLIDSGIVVYDNGIELLKRRKRSSDYISDLEEWKSIYPTFPFFLKKENGFVPYNEPPMPIGGYKAIAKNLKYPRATQLAGIEGMVIVLAFIDEKGNPSKFEIKKSLNQQYDEAAIDAIRNTKFIPAKFKGRPKKLWISVPINFRLKR